MSTHQLGWTRSYRQALEKLVSLGVDRMYFSKRKTDMRFATAQLRFVADLWQVPDVISVIDDIDHLRMVEADWLRSCELRAGSVDVPLVKRMARDMHGLPDVQAKER